MLIGDAWSGLQVASNPLALQGGTPSDAATQGTKLRAERGLYTIGKGRRAPVLQPARRRLRQRQGPLTETSLQRGRD